MEFAIGGLLLVGIGIAIVVATRKRRGRRYDPKPLASGGAMPDDWGRRQR